MTSIIKTLVFIFFHSLMQPKQKLEYTGYLLEEQVKHAAEAELDLHTCSRVVCRAAQLADSIRKVDLLQLELPLHAEPGRAQTTE